MPLIQPPPAPKKSQNLALIIILIFVVTSFIGIATIVLFVGFRYFTAAQLTSQYDEPPQAAAPYLGSDLLPKGLPAPPALFKQATPTPSTGLIANAPMPSGETDFDQIAKTVLALPMPSVPKPLTRASGKPNPAILGLQVCLPITPPQSKAETTNFAVSCGNWLHLISAGQPELGRTPPLSDFGRYTQEMGWKGFQLTPSDAKNLSSMSGVTNVACGTLSGTEPALTLTYQLYSVPDLRTLGPPIVEKGSADQITASLPKIALAFDNDLGIKSPSIPASTGLTGKEMTELGRIKDDTTQSYVDLQELSDLSAKSPIAGTFLLGTVADDDQVISDRTVKELITQAPANALVLDYICSSDPDELRTHAEQDNILFKRYPGNALFAHTEVLEQRSWGSLTNEIAAAYRCIADSPNNPEAWLTPATSLYSLENCLREGRTVDDISQTELGYLTSIYSKMQSFRAEATHIDPNYGHAWERLLESATFTGDIATAKEAAKKAEALDPDTSEVYIEELECYQPKWFGDPLALRRAAAKAVEGNYDVGDELNIANALTNVSYSDQNHTFATMSSWVVANTIKRQRAFTAEDPDAPIRAWDLGSALAADGSPSSLREATREYRIAEYYLPNVAQLHFAMADVMAERHKATEQVAELERAVELSPFYTDAHLKLGYALKGQRKFTQAISELALASRLEPNQPDPHLALGDLYLMRNQNLLAEGEYKHAISIQLYYIYAWFGLANTFDNMHKYQDSIGAASQAIEYDEGKNIGDTQLDGDAHDTIADDYLNLKKWSESLDQTHQALAFNPSDVTAQENLAEAYWGEGKADEARAQWNIVASLNDPYTSPIARKFLAEHPASASSSPSSSKIE